MKQLLLFSLLFVLMLTACQKKDIDALNGKLNNLEGRFSTLESAVKDMNSDIRSLQQLTEALQKNIGIRSYAAISTGYLLTMSDGSTIELKNGANGQNGTNGKDGVDAPRIGVKQDTDGEYYWTLAGEFLLQSGMKIRVTGNDGHDGSNGVNGITPMLRVNTDLNYWMISYDNGVNWQPVTDAAGNTIPATGAAGTPGPQGPAGPAGVTGFNISETEAAITITYMGSTYTIPKTTSSSIGTWIIAAGDRFTFLLEGNGNLYATGANESGQLGTGTTINRSSPVFVMDNVKSVSAGIAHTLILKNDGTLYAVGENGNGELGIGSTADQSLPQFVTDGVKDMAAGYMSSLLLKNDGKLYAAGDNTFGQLLTSNYTSENTPKLVMENVADVEAGRNGAAALKTDGKLYTSSYKMRIETYYDPTLGTISNTYYYPLSPTVASDNVKKMSVGYSIYFIKNDDKLYGCAVLNTNIGVNEYQYYAGNPSWLMDDVKSVSEKGSDVMVLKSSGALYGRGLNSNGELGIGDNTQRSNFSPITTNVSIVSTGSSHSVIMKTDGKLYATGNNSKGQLGIGNTTDKNVFTLIPEFE